MDVLSSRNDDARTGAALHEAVLTPDKVSQAAHPGDFGKLFHYDLAAIGGQPVGQIYAQPLFVSQVSVAGRGLINMLLVATMGNLVVALDADGPSPGHDGVLWVRRFGTAPGMDDAVWRNCAISHCLVQVGGNIVGTAGIGSTPVIDRQRGIVFVVNRELTGSGFAVEYRLHALDLHDGHDLPGSPTVIRGSSQGTTFVPDFQNQRAGLALSLGKVIIGFGAYEDLLAYRGWVFSYAYNPNSGFSQSAVLTTTPDGDITAQCDAIHHTLASSAAEAGLLLAEAKLVFDIFFAPPLIGLDLAAIAAAQVVFNAVALPQIIDAANTCAHGGVWMTGRAPAIDPDGRVLLMVGNGRNDLGQPPNRNFGNSLLALDPASLQVLDSFTPSNHIVLNAHDLDLGGSGPMLVPGSRLVVGGGKQGVMHVWNLDRLGGFSSNDGGVLQKFTAGIVEPHLDTGVDNPGGAIDFWHLFNTAFSLDLHAGHIMGGPVYWPRPATVGGSRLFNWSENSELRMYAVDETALTPVQLPELAKSAYVQAGHPGGIISLSANGSTPGSGIVWASTYDASRTYHVGLGTTGALIDLVPGVLRAYSATDLTPIWSSLNNAGDAVGTFAKFNPPTVANGRVYLANFSGQVLAYGLHSHPYQRPAKALYEVIEMILDDE